MLKSIQQVAEQFIEKTKDKPVQIISHFDTDGISSAAILIKALQRLDKEFSLKIVKQIEKSTIEELSQDKVLIFLDLASNSFDYIKNLKTEVFILDHHEIISEIPKNVAIINPHLFDKEEISGAGITYLFAKALNEKNIDLAYLAVIGMVGDLLEKNIGKIFQDIIKDSKVVVKRGLILYPATRPIDRVLMYTPDIFIPKVTGSSTGVNNFLRDIGLKKDRQYKSIIELTNGELSKLITAISLQRTDNREMSDLIGNIYLINFFNKLEDVRQISAMINACSRNGDSGTAIAFCLQNKTAKEKAEGIYTKHRQNIVKALDSIPTLKKIEEKNYIIINAEDKITDTIIGTIAGILSHSRDYEEGKAIIAMAYNKDKIKISARMVGKSGKNIREVLNSVIEIIGGEVGGHSAAAGCLIEKYKEKEFIEELKRKLEVEIVKIN